MIDSVREGIMNVKKDPTAGGMSPKRGLIGSARCSVCCIVSSWRQDLCRADFRRFEWLSWPQQSLSEVDALSGLLRLSIHSVNRFSRPSLSV